MFFFRRPRRETIDCSEGLLRLKLATTQQLYVIRDETENIECVDLLLSSSTSLVATFTGDNLLISYIIPHDQIQRKFLVKFASTAMQTGRQHCEDCVQTLSRLIKITPLESTSSTSLTDMIGKSHSIVSLTDMIQMLMNQETSKLSTYYNYDLDIDGYPMNEYLEKYLSDETFPDFVANVAAILESMKNNSS